MLEIENTAFATTKTKHYVFDVLLVNAFLCAWFQLYSSFVIKNW